MSATLAWSSATFELRYVLPSEAVDERMESFALAGLLPAMRRAEALELPGSVSPRLLDSLRTIQEIYHCWSRKLTPVPIQVPGQQPTGQQRGRGVACFFSGGLDSFYVLLKHEREIDALISVPDFEYGPVEGPVRVETGRSLRAAAAELGKPLLEVRTNLRRLLDPVLSWRLAHGLGLSCVAHALAPLFHTFYLAAGRTYAQGTPNGLDLILQDRFSSESVELRIDGAEASRVDKAARVAECDTALRRLRVCARYGAGVRNCGCCEKCLRTMISLDIVGALTRCPTFDRPLEPEIVARLLLTKEDVQYAQENLEALRQRGEHGALAQALQTALEESPRELVRHQADKLRRLERTLTSTQAWITELENSLRDKERELHELQRWDPARVWRRPGAVRTNAKGPAL